MTVSTSAYAALGAPIAFEVAGTTLLQKSEQSARIGPTLGMAACYTATFFLMSVALNAMPLGVVYVEAILADPVVERRNRAALYLSALADPDVRRVDRGAWSGTAQPMARRPWRSSASPSTGRGTPGLLHASGGPLPDLAALRGHLPALAPPG